MYVIKKSEHQRTDAFELWCWRRLFRVPWTPRRANQSILKEISTEYSLEGLLLKLNANTLATWFEELTHWKRPWCWERLKAGGEGDNRGWDGWMASPTQWTWVWVNSRSWWWIGRPAEKAMAPHSSTLAWKIPWTKEPGGLQSMPSLRVGHNWATSLSFSCIGEGNGNPLQCSCLENPRDGGAW